MQLEETSSGAARWPISGDRGVRGSYPVAERDPVILCVDDESDMLTLLRLFLSARGFEIVTASNAAEALDVIEEQRPDLIVTDCIMPGMSGVELCRALRDHAATRDIPIVLHSGRDVPDADRSLFDRYLLKPARLDALARVISGLLPASHGQEFA